MELKYDQAEEWYLGSGTPAGYQMDLRSTAAHEFGHGLGLDHTQAGNCGAPRATMCAGQIVGTTEQRTLETDDVNGVSTAYP